MKYLNTEFVKKRISQIGLGTSRFGSIVPEETAFEFLDSFVEYGGTVVDTARNYYEWVENGRGKSEQCLGRWMDKHHNRDEICVSTKGGVRNKGSEWTIDLSKQNLCKELAESLDALHTDYIDIYLLHRDDVNRPVGEIMETLQELQELGRIGILGAANWSCERIIQANEYAEKHGMQGFDIIQTWWTVADYTKEMWNDDSTTHMDRKTIDYMRANRLIGMAYTSQSKGFFQKAILNGIDGVDKSLLKRIDSANNRRIFEYLEEYLSNHDVTMTDLVNGYITSDNVQGIALVSCSSQEQLLDILEHCDYDMPSQVIEKIRGMKEGAR